MQISPALITLVALGLGACQMPPAPCRSAATPEIRQIDALIAETQTAIARGYVRGPVASGRGDPSVRVCVGSAGDNVGVSFCSPGWDGVRRGPVAIDPAAEKRKLEALQARRNALVRQANADLAACRSSQP